MDKEFFITQIIKSKPPIEVYEVSLSSYTNESDWIQGNRYIHLTKDGKIYKARAVTLEEIQKVVEHIQFID